MFHMSCQWLCDGDRTEGFFGYENVCGLCKLLVCAICMGVHVWIHVRHDKSEYISCMSSCQTSKGRSWGGGRAIYIYVYIYICIYIYTWVWPCGNIWCSQTASTPYFFKNPEVSRKSWLDDWTLCWKKTMNLSLEVKPTFLTGYKGIPISWGDCLACALGVCYRFLGILGCLLDCLGGDVLKLEFKSWRRRIWVWLYKSYGSYGWFVCSWCFVNPNFSPPTWV